MLRALDKADAMLTLWSAL